ncbi:MAG: SGNH/GDSL hydrolase family protein [archaeon]
MKKRRLSDILLLILSLSLFLVLAELSTRAMGTYSANDLMLNRTMAGQGWREYAPFDNPNLVYEPRHTQPDKPGYATDYHSRAFRINKLPNTFRIIGIGDSHMQGWGGYDLTAALERKLNNLSDNITFEVLNYGVGGYNLIQKKVLLDEKIKELHPDLLIIQILDNDCSGDRVYLPGSQYTIESTDFYEVSYGVVIPFVIPLPDRMNRELIRYSHFYRYLSARLYTIKKKLSSNTEENWRDFLRTEVAMAEILEISDEINAKSVFFLSHQVKYELSDYPKYRDERISSGWLNSMDAQLNLSMVRLLPLIKGHDYRELKADEQGHYNRIGYEIATNAIFDALIQRKLVPVDTVKEPNSKI